MAPLTSNVSRKELGRQGESLAAALLTKKGYRILRHNLTFSFGEIDLLCEDGQEIVVVEVKSSRRLGVIDPVYRIGPLKRRKLLFLAQAVTARYSDRNVRIDAVTLYWSRTGEPILTHYQDITS